MAMTINTNVVSINAQRNLGLSGGALATSMQRLSSGLRVNSAKDDAAGLAISERMGAQARGLSVAARNANDGISLAQTAEGALGKVGDMLQRMRELAVQSSNATNSESDRKALNAEVQQMVAEIDRVAKTSSFNGKKLLDGTFAGGVFQVGANAGDNITVGALADAKAASIGKTVYGVSTAATVATLTPAQLGAAAGFATSGVTGAWSEGAAIAETTLATAAAEAAAPAAASVYLQVNDGVNTYSYNLGAFEAATTTEARVGELVARINAKTADTGITAFLEKDASGAWTFTTVSANTHKDSTGVEVANTSRIQGLTAATFGFAASAISASATQEGIDKTNISTQVGAWKAIKQIDEALDTVNAARGTLGALQTRFEKSVENIDIMNENISAARGRIIDADFASETANLSRSQILQQAGTAMVAQANQLSQNVLSLLR